MFARSRRLDEYVRHATKLDGDEAAALADPDARQALFEQITRVPVDVHSGSPHQPARRLHLALTATAVLAVAGLAAAVLASAGALTSTGVLTPRDRLSVTASMSTRAGEQSPTAAGSGAISSCVEGYSPQTLTRRLFAFDGTVIGIGKAAAASNDHMLYVPVTFTVNRWFRGGHGDRFTVAMEPPGRPSTVENLTYAVGSRLLVSGMDRWNDPDLTSPIAWTCGFTRPYNEADAQDWERALR